MVTTWKTKVGDPENAGGQIYLHNNKVNEVPGEDNQAITADELRVELQKWTDYVHIHYKWFRFDFTIDEFLEFSEVISTSSERLKATPMKFPKELVNFMILAQGKS